MRFRELLIEHVTYREYGRANALVRSVATGANFGLLERLTLAARTGAPPETLIELIEWTFANQTLPPDEASLFNCLILTIESRVAATIFRLSARTLDPDGSTRTIGTLKDEVVFTYQPGSIDKELATAREEIRNQRWNPPRAPTAKERLQKIDKRHGLRIGRALIKRGLVEESRLTDFLSKQYGVPAINLNDFDISQEIIDLVPHELAARYLVVPVNRAGPSLIVAMADPSNIYAVDDLAAATGYRAIEPVVASQPDIENAIRRYYGGVGEEIPSRDLYEAAHFAAFAAVLAEVTSALVTSKQFSELIRPPAHFLGRWLSWEGDVGHLRCEWRLRPDR